MTNDELLDEILEICENEMEVGDPYSSGYVAASEIFDLIHDYYESLDQLVDEEEEE